MLLGFISLLLTVGQGPISNICISKKVGATWHPCNKKQEDSKYEDEAADTEEHQSNGRRLLEAALASGGAGRTFRRVLAAAGTDKCAEKVRTTDGGRDLPNFGCEIPPYIPTFFFFFFLALSFWIL